MAGSWRNRRHRRCQPHGRASRGASVATWQFFDTKRRVGTSTRCTRCQDVRRLPAHGKPAYQARPTVRDRADASSPRRARTALARALLWLVVGCGPLNLTWLVFCASDRLAPSPSGNDNNAHGVRDSIWFWSVCILFDLSLAREVT